jgi:hypothetical protein
MAGLPYKSVGGHVKASRQRRRETTSNSRNRCGYK